MKTKDFVDPLELRRFDCKRPPPESAPVYYLGEVPICTSGNLSTILAAPKVGKSAFLGAAIASVIKPPHVTCDTFGITSQNPHGHALLHFDTEQSPQDHWSAVSTAMRRAQLTEQPDWLRSYSLTGENAINACQLVLRQIQLLKEIFGGIHSVFIDGYADLVLDVNDAKETQLLVTELHRYAIACSCPIIGVLHYNPGSEKGRGHLGSQLERRAETNLALSKHGTLTEVWSDKQRKDPIPKGQGPTYTWSKELKMHVSVSSTYETQQTAKRKEALSQAKSVFGDEPELRYGALRTTLISVLKKSESTSERKIEEWARLGVIYKTDANLWKLNVSNGYPHTLKQPSNGIE